jgi:hypothetical protein
MPSVTKLSPGKLLNTCRVQTLLSNLKRFKTMGKWKINNNEVILFRKSDFPETDETHSLEQIKDDVGYRTYIYEKYKDNKERDVKCYNYSILFERINAGEIDFDLRDYYIFFGVEYYVS